MATTWYITCVKTDSLGTITHVGVGTDPSGFGRKAQTKATVASWLRNGDVAYARSPTRPSDIVQVHPVNGTGGPYLRTDRDQYLEDNLSHLPECTGC